MPSRVVLPASITSACHPALSTATQRSSLPYLHSVVLRSKNQTNADCLMLIEAVICTQWQARAGEYQP